MILLKPCTIFPISINVPVIFTPFKGFLQDEFMGTFSFSSSFVTFNHSIFYYSNRGV